jgi:hypothetical protein
VENTTTAKPSSGTIFPMEVHYLDISEFFSCTLTDITMELFSKHQLLPLLLYNQR